MKWLPFACSLAAVLLPMLTLVAIVAWEYGSAARHTIEAQRLDVANNLRILIEAAKAREATGAGAGSADSGSPAAPRNPYAS